MTHPINLESVRILNEIADGSEKGYIAIVSGRFDGTAVDYIARIMWNSEDSMYNITPIAMCITAELMYDVEILDEPYKQGCLMCDCVDPTAMAGLVEECDCACHVA